MELEQCGSWVAAPHDGEAVWCVRPPGHRGDHESVWLTEEKLAKVPSHVRVYWHDDATCKAEERVTEGVGETE